MANPLNTFSNTPHVLLAEALRLGKNNRQCEQAINGVEKQFTSLTPALVQLQKQRNINIDDIKPIQGLLNELVEEIKLITPEAAQLNSEEGLTFVQQIAALANQIATKIFGTNKYDAKFFRELNQELIPTTLDIRSSMENILHPPSAAASPAAAGYEELAAQPTPETEEPAAEVTPEPELLVAAGCSWEENSGLKVALTKAWNNAFEKTWDLPESRSRTRLLKELNRVKEAVTGNYKPYVSNEIQVMTEEDLNYKMPKEQQRSLSRLFPQLIQQLETATKASPTEETLVYAAGCIERMSQLLEEFSRYTPKPTVRQTVADTIQLAAMAQLVSTKNGDEPISEEALATTERLVEQQQQDSETMALLAREQLTSPLDSEKIKKSLRAVVTEINSPKAAEKTAAIVAEGPGFLASILADLAAIGNFFSWLGSFITSCFSSSSEEA